MTWRAGDPRERQASWHRSDPQAALGPAWSCIRAQPGDTLALAAYAPGHCVVERLVTIPSDRQELRIQLQLPAVEPGVLRLVGPGGKGEDLSGLYGVSVILPETGLALWHGELDLPASSAGRGFRAHLPPGRYRVEVSSSVPSCWNGSPEPYGFQRWSREVEVSSGKVERVSVELKRGARIQLTARIAGNLPPTVDSTQGIGMHAAPADANAVCATLTGSDGIEHNLWFGWPGLVYAFDRDAFPLGVTSYSLHPLEPGPYALTLEGDGVETFHTSIQLRADRELTELEFTLAPKLAASTRR